MADGAFIPESTKRQIDDDIKKRVAEHQAVVARLKTARRQPQISGLATTLNRQLLLLAHGDSWFDYPLSGNDFTFGTTDVIAQLKTMGSTPPVILNLSHHGDATTDEMSLPKQERMISALQDSNNWLDSGKPDAILFSGGGDDIAGDQFCIFLNYASDGASGLNQTRFEKVLGMVEASYLDLFAFRDRYAPGVPVIAHSYDFAIPNGAHPACAGPWLLPSLQYCNWSVLQGTAIVRDALTQFDAMLKNLAGIAQNRFVLAETQGTLAAGDWANELHPFPDGFKKIANVFLASLNRAFPAWAGM